MVRLFGGKKKKESDRRSAVIEVPQPAVEQLRQMHNRYASAPNVMMQSSEGYGAAAAAQPIHPYPSKQQHRQLKEPTSMSYGQQQQQPPPPQQAHTTMSISDSGQRVMTTVTHVPPPPAPAPAPVMPPDDPEASSSSMNESGAAASASAKESATKDAATALTRDLVKKFIADIWNRGEIDLIPEVCSPSLRFNGNTGFDRVGHDGLARMVSTIRDALDEYHCEIHSMVVENNKAFCRLRFTGKHTGSLLGYEPTHKVVAWMGATEFTCQNGKILKVWELGDVKSLEEQLSGDDGGKNDHTDL